MTTKIKTRVILTGFMGTGKTAVGQALAKKLQYDFLDTDLMVEEETGQSITEIFEKDGEAVFREHEKKMVKKALERDKVVIATGGGVVLDEENRTLMKDKGTLIALSAAPEIILERIKGLQTRPLLKEKNRLEAIENLLSHRSPYYRKADHIIDTTGRKIEETVEEIFKILHANNTD